MIRRFVTAAALCVLAAGRSACAWNGTGHEIIALIAWQDLTPQARASITRLLVAHPDHDTLLTKAATPAEDKAREAFLTAATWPDLVRTPNTPSSKYNHPVWHYVDMPFALGVDLPPMPDEKWDPAKDPANAAQAWQKCVDDLTNAKLDDKDRGIALCWIEHLAGDIHQPLHAISLFSERLPTGDQGGNLMTVRTGDRTSNLHSLWDGLLGSDESWDNVNRTAHRIAEAHPRSEFAAELNAVTFHRWMESSAERAKSVVYMEGALPFLTRQELNQDRTRTVPELPAGYMDRAHSTAETCAALAGYRLADRLNDWLGKPPQ